MQCISISYTELPKVCTAEEFAETTLSFLEIFILEYQPLLLKCTILFRGILSIQIKVCLVLFYQICQNTPSWAKRHSHYGVEFSALIIYIFS